MSDRASTRLVRILRVSILVIVGSGCTASLQHPAGTPTIDGSTIVAEIASYQSVARQPGRLLIALLAGDGRWLSFGDVDVALSYLGDGDRSAPTTASLPGQHARFLPIPGSPEDDGGAPTLTIATDGHGVYAVEPITFPTAGYWQAAIHGQLRDGSAFSAKAALAVLEAPSIIAVGSLAPRTRNPVIGDVGVDPVSIDSRAMDGQPIPDPELHEVSIAEAIDAGHPALVVFSTPVYCVSRFCGPVTDLVAELAAEYGDRADFIHVEIYRDFKNGLINQAALDWLSDGSGDLREPWTFLIGADGRIAASWDTVVTRSEIEPLLAALPLK
jgi:hypothetical protein